MNTEPTVEEALAELRETFPAQQYLSVEHVRGGNVRGVGAASRISATDEWAVTVGSRTTTTALLSQAMAQVRQWHQENKQWGRLVGNERDCNNDNS